MRELFDSNRTNRRIVRNHLQNVGYLGMLITLRMAEDGFDERKSYDRLCAAVDKEIQTQLGYFGARARCRAADLECHGGLTGDSTDFLLSWIYDVTHTHQPYNNPQRPSPTISVLNSGSYEAPLMFYLREKELLHRFVSTHFAQNRHSSYDEAVDSFNRTAQRLGLGDPNDFWPQSQSAGRRVHFRIPPALNTNQRRFLENSRKWNAPPEESAQVRSERMERLSRTPAPVK